MIRWIALLLLILSSRLSLAQERVLERSNKFALEQDVMVPMRDGVRLATDIYRPTKDGVAQDEPLPVILARLPYNKQGRQDDGAYYATHGYVFVAQDTRGRYNSEGVWHMLTDDGPDGVDCAAWIGKQSWSDGKIGMIGTSYFGGTQHAMALAGAPELKTVIPVDAMSNMGRQSLRNAGAFEIAILELDLPERRTRQSRGAGSRNG